MRAARFHMLTERPLEALGTEVPNDQGSAEFQLFTSLLRLGSGWFANNALQRRHHE